MAELAGREKHSRGEKGRCAAQELKLGGFLQEKDDKEKAELEEARQADRESSIAFHGARQKRSEVFTKAFDHIKGVIDPIYKDLTKSKASIHTAQRG